MCRAPPQSLPLCAIRCALDLKRTEALNDTKEKALLA